MKKLLSIILLTIGMTLTVHATDPVNIGRLFRSSSRPLRRGRG